MLIGWSLARLRDNINKISALFTFTCQVQSLCNRRVCIHTKKTRKLIIFWSLSAQDA